jgi:hypothetical protein
MSIIEELIEESKDYVSVILVKNDESQTELRLMTPTKIALKQNQITNSAKEYVRFARLAAVPANTADNVVAFREFAASVNMDSEQGYKDLNSTTFWETACMLSLAMIEPSLDVYSAAKLSLKRPDVIAKISESLEASTKSGSGIYQELKND